MRVQLPRQRRLRSFRKLNQRTSPVTPPRRHNPRHHVLPPDDARNHPSIAIVLKRVVLLFWHTLAHGPLGDRRLGPLNFFPSSSAMTGERQTRFSSAARHPRRRRAWPFGRPTPAEAVWRRSVSPFFSRSHSLAQTPDRSSRRRPLPRQTPPRARNFDADRLFL